MAYGDFEDLKKRTAGDKVLKDKAFNIAMVNKFLIKRLEAVVSLRLQINLLLNLHLKMNN